MVHGPPGAGGSGDHKARTADHVCTEDRGLTTCVDELQKHKIKWRYAASHTLYMLVIIVGIGRFYRVTSVKSVMSVDF